MYYRNYRGRVVISENGRRQKEYLHNLFAINHGVKLEGKVQLSIMCYYRDNRVRDIDNVLKPLIDCLKDVYFGDDSLIQKITIEKQVCGTDYTIVRIDPF